MTLKNNNSIQDLSNKVLSIQISLNGLSFCTWIDQQITSINHESFGIQLTPEQILNKIKYIFDHNADLKENFDKINVIYQNDMYTVVPKPLFNTESLNNYLKYNIKVLENDFIAYDELEQHNIITVYIPYTNINNFFFDNFGTFTYKHTSTILIDSLLTKKKNSKSSSVFVNINDISFDITVITNGNLILCNTYTYQTKEDFLYYLLFTTEQLQLNPEEFELIFIGNISKNHAIYKIAHTYVRNISLGENINNIELAKDIPSFDPHKHFVLLSSPF